MTSVHEWMTQRNRPLVMGVLNVTPDSFYDGGRYGSLQIAVDHALEMTADGADILDVGGESSRPGARPVSESEEMDRTLPVIEAIRRQTDIPISIDTTRSAVAAAALEAGASIVNDISALRADPNMVDIVASCGALVVLMHMQGTPATMQTDPSYDDVVENVSAFLRERLAWAIAHGIPEERIILDPGIGFGKRLSDNLELIRHTDRLAAIGPPLLYGCSRKAFIGAILDLPPEERLEGTIAAHAVAIARGACMIRVHDVKEGRRAADLAWRLRIDER